MTNVSGRFAIGAHSCEAASGCGLAVRAMFAILATVWLSLAATVCARGVSDGDAQSRAQPAPAARPYSVSEIAQLFDRPNNVLELLRNLKIAADTGLLLQPAFTADANLMKFFNGSAVRHERSRQVTITGAESDVEHTFVTIDQAYFPKMTVEVEQGQWKIKAYSRHPTRSTPVRVERFGSISMGVRAVPEFTVCSVRDVFGRESASSRDSGAGPDGVSYVPQVKGRLVYQDGGTVPAPTVIVGRNSTFQIELDKDRMEVGWPSERQRRAIHNRDQIQGLLIYIPEPRR